MNQLIESDELLIEDMIFKVRGLQVMLSSNIAKLYQVETKRIPEVIKRNINRFPASFCFQLTRYIIFKFSICDLKQKHIKSHTMCDQLIYGHYF